MEQTLAVDYRPWWRLTEAQKGKTIYLLSKAIDESQGEEGIDKTLEELRNGEYWLLCALESDGTVVAAFTVLEVKYSNFTALRVVLGGSTPGQMNRWLKPLIEKLEEGAATIGAAQLEIFGRQGFAKALKQYADVAYTVMVRKVSNGRRKQNQDRKQTIGLSTSFAGADAERHRPTERGCEDPV
jgi:hypothetical protein